MNSLAILSKLKTKPVHKQNTGINVIISGDETGIKDTGPAKFVTDVEVEKTRQILMVEQLDNGQRAKDVLERLKKTRLSGVTNKQPKVSQEQEKGLAPEPLKESEQEKEKETIAAKPKKQKKSLILEEELDTQKILGDNLPEGGPRLQELQPQKLILEQDEIVDQPIEPVENVVVENVVVEKPQKKKQRSEKGVVTLLPGPMVQVGDTSLKKRLPPPPVYNLKVSEYYMNNRELFVQFINGLFSEYKDDLQDETKNISCDEIGKDTGKVGLLTHQKIVRDYINLYTPYRGLLLYHGLGSGKTCSSIAIAEGLKSYRKIIVMTPASLRRNYIEEIKKCGDLLYRKNQFWEWISIENNRELVEPLSAVLGLKVEYIERNKGAWLVNVSKPSNYATLSTSDKSSLNNQLDLMIQNKYTFINYNGLRRDNFAKMTQNFEKNIFDNSVVIIDEAHNLISRIVNKINRMNKFSEKKRGPQMEIYTHLALQLYEFLLRAENCRVILLTGTPIINYPNEIGILFNILRGYIKTWHLPIINKEEKRAEDLKIKKETILGFFANEKILDYIDYDANNQTLIVTRNPFGFQNKITASSGYKGVRYDKHDVDENGNYISTEEGVVKDDEFIKRIVKIIRHNGFDVNPKSINFTVNTALPDTLDSFVNNFINKESGEIINLEKFKRRIIGLTSYFKSAQEELLPRYDKLVDKHIVRVPMSDYQFQIYEDARFEERKTEKPSNAKQKVDVDGMFVKPVSTYKIFSRLFCNFVMPKPPGRPTPGMARQVEGLKWLENYFNEKQIKDEIIRKNILKYIETLPSNFAENEENVALLKNQIIKYQNTYILNIHSSEKIPDFETFITTQPKEIEEPQAPAVAPVKISKGEAKERERLAKEQEAERKRLEKQTAKELKELEKIAAKEAKELEKKNAKELKELEKLAKKETKALEKAAIKKGKGSDDMENEDNNEPEDEENDETDEEDENAMKSIPSYLKGGEGDDDDDGDNADTNKPIQNQFEEWVDSQENSDELVSFDIYKDEDSNYRDKDELEGDEILEKVGGDDYKVALENALSYLNTHKEQFLNLEALEQYSPKFLKMIENIQDHNHPGLHLIYSQFRSMEGVGIFALALEANGFARFKISRTGSNTWQINMSEEEMGKPTYALYTGTEDAEEREIIRNIYNGDWNNIPNNIATQLRARSTNNNMGEIIRVLMITSAGSEGINLRNTRYVHVMEPYWHPVRVEQVIGRARRICSHQGLEEQFRTVEVFIYVMVFTEKQLESDSAIAIKLKDTSKFPPFNPQTTDENLFEISKRKEELTEQLLVGIKEASIDCATHIGSNSKEKLKCLTFNKPTINDFSYKPNISEETNDDAVRLNRTERTWEGRAIKFTTEVNGKLVIKPYMLRPDTNDIYDYESAVTKGAEPILVGKLVKRGAKNFEIEFL